MAVTIPGYEQFRPIGSGGFSTVYEARQPELNRRVAVKVLTLGADKDFDRAAFEGECRAMGTVSEHPNIVTVFGSGFSEDGFPYIAMELYNETLLDKIKARGFLPLDEVLSLGVMMASALHRAHIERLLHRDIKPQNIFFSQYDEPVLGDFGIAAVATEQHQQKSFGMTFHYAAPEVIEGELPSVESDIYSLGATLYTALAGHRPFARPGAKENEAVIANRIMSEPPPPIGSQSVPDNIERSLFSLLAKHANDRPRTALAAGKLLRDLQSRMGYELTPMRVAVNDFDDDHTQPRSPLTQAAPESPPNVAASTTDERSPQPAAPVVDDSLSASVTVYRASERARPTSDFTEPETNTSRPLIGVGVLVVLLAVVGAGYFLLGGSPEDDLIANETGQSSTTTTSLLISEPPESVSEATLVSETEGEVAISWEAAERAVEYRIDFVTGDRLSMTLEETETVIDVTDEPAGVPICVEVVAIAENGRTAAPSAQSCTSP